MNVFSTLKPQQQKNLKFLFAAGLLFWSSLGSLLPTLPLYVEDVGGTTQQVGLVIGAFAVGLLLCRPTVGNLADRRSRKLVVLIGIIVVAIAPLGYLFVTSIPLLLLLRVFHGVSIAAYTTGNSALIVDLSPVHQRGEIIGYMSLANPVGMATGPAIGGLLQAQYGYTPLFLFAAVTGLLSLLFAAQVNEPPLIEYKEDAGASDRFWEMLARPSLRTPAIVLLLTGLVFGTIATFVALFIRESGIDFNAGWFYTAAAISSFGIRFLTGRASDRYGRGIFITGSLICYIVAVLLLSYAHSPAFFLLAGLLEGAGGGTMIPMMIALISDRSQPQERGRVFSLCVGGFDVGIAVAGPIFGGFVASIGYQGIFAINAALGILALLVFVTKNSKSLRQSLRFATGRDRDTYALEFPNS